MDVDDVVLVVLTVSMFFFGVLRVAEIIAGKPVDDTTMAAFTTILTLWTTAVGVFVYNIKRQAKASTEAPTP
jgi:hypothetical protein